MTREDIKTVNKEIINRRLLDEYGNNALKIEELEKEINLYSYNKKTLAFAYIISILTITLGMFLQPIMQIPLFLGLPLLTLVSSSIGIIGEKILNKIIKSKNKYTLFKQNTKRIDKYKLEKIKELNRLKSKNKFLSKSMDILKKKSIFISKKEIQEEKTFEEINNLEKLIDNETYITEFIKTKSFWKNITSESKYILTIGLISFLSLGFFQDKNIINNIGIILYNTLTFTSLALDFSIIIMLSVNNTEKKVKEKISLLQQQDNKITDKTIKDIDKKLIKNITYDIAYQKVELLEQEIVDAVTSKSSNNEYIKEKFKLKEASNKRKNKKTLLRSNLIIKNKYIYPFKRISN